MKLFRVLFLTCFMISCSNNSNEFYTYSFTENSKLNIENDQGSYMKYSNIENGDNLVFEYHYSAEHNLNISDDEYAEFIRFEIDPLLTEFSYTDNQLTEINTVFTKSCFCGFSNEPDKNVGPKGTINGIKLSNDEWNITINTVFYGDESKSITNNFVLKN